jgi:hypothetical protein
MSRRRAADDWREFHWGDEPTEIISANLYVPSAGETLVVLGKLRRVDYETTKAGELAVFWHEFSRPTPYLCAGPRGSLHVVGGRYRIEPRGIVG